MSDTVTNESIVKPEIDYSSREVEHGTYQLSRIVPQSGSQTVNLQSTSTVTSVFELPTKPINLSKSKLIFDLNIPAMAAKCGKIHGVGLPMIDRLSLMTRTGTYLADVSNFNYYSRMATLATTAKEELLSRGFFDVANTGADATTNNFEVLDAVNPYLASDGYNWKPEIDTIKGREVGEPQWSISGTAAGAGGTAATARYVITLGDISGTIFSIPQDLVFNEVVQLQITWGQFNKIAWGSDSATKAASPADVPVALTAGTLTNLQMLVAMEINADVIRELTMKMRTSGLHLIIPWVTNTHSTNSSASSFSMSQKIGPMYGQRLLRTYFSTFDGSTQTLNTAYNNVNYTSQTNSTTKMLDSFYTSLNSERIQPYDMRPADYSDYAIMKPLLKGSCVSSGDIHRKNHVFIDDWTGAPLVESRRYDCMVNGIDTSSELTYAVVVNGVGTAPPATFDSYLAFVTQRTLTITPDAIMIK